MAGLIFAVLALALVVALVLVGNGALQEHQRQIDQLRAELRLRTPATLTTRMEDLQSAFTTLQVSTRRELSSMWKRIGLAVPRPSVRDAATIDNETGDLLDADTDPELRAYLDLQSAPAPQPRGKRE